MTVKLLHAAIKAEAANCEDGYQPIKALASSPISLGFGWDTYTPRTESGIVQDCMRLQALTPHLPILVTLDPDLPPEERNVLAGLLKRLQIQVVTHPVTLHYFKSYVQTRDSTYRPEQDHLRRAKQLRNVAEPKVAKIRLRPNLHDPYPHLPTREYLAPPGTLPQYKTRPSNSGPAFYTLPMWARND